MKSEKCKVQSELGLTLMEAVITLGIVSVLGILLPVIIINTTGLFYKESSKVQQGLGINDTLINLREIIKGSTGVMAQYPISGVPTYTSSDTQIVLKLPALDSSNNIITDIFDYFVFYLDQGRVKLKTFPDALSARKVQNQILISNINTIKFQYYNLATPPQEVTPNQAKKVKITLTLKQKSGKEYETSIATSEANLRND